MLIDSLHPEKEFDSEEAWSKEQKKRIDRYEQGESSAKPWSKVNKNALYKLAGCITSKSTRTPPCFYQILRLI